MDLRMAQRASLELSGQIVKTGRARSAAEARSRVALQAELIDIGEFQEMRIGGAMGRVAIRATFRLHRLVLIYERPLLVLMTLEADLVLCRRGTQLSGVETAMRIVAIGALDHAFVDLVVPGHVEL